VALPLALPLGLALALPLPSGLVQLKGRRMTLSNFQEYRSVDEYNAIPPSICVPVASIVRLDPYQ